MSDVRIDSFQAERCLKLMKEDIYNTDRPDKELILDLFNLVVFLDVRVRELKNQVKDLQRRC